MKRLMVGGLALGFTAVGSLALGGPAGAQEGEPEPEYVELTGQLSADVVAPGETVTASSVDPCTVTEEGGELLWIVWSADPDVTDVEAEGSVPLAADGSWSVEFQAPANAGEYEFDALCVPGYLPPEEEEELEDLAAEGLQTLGDEGEGPELPEEPPAPLEYYYLPFTVDGGDGPPVTEPPADTPTPPVAAPAQPVVGEPTFTG
jgi:hypothetical protein